MRLTPWLAMGEAMREQVETAYDVAWDEDAPEHVLLLDDRGRGIELDLPTDASTRLRWAVMVDGRGRA